MQKDERQKRINELVKQMLSDQEEIPDVMGTDESFFEDVPDITDEENEIHREASKIALAKFISKQH